MVAPAPLSENWELKLILIERMLPKKYARLNLKGAEFKKKKRYQFRSPDKN